MGFQWTAENVSTSSAYLVGPLKVSVLSTDARHPWDGIIEGKQTPWDNPEVLASREPWVAKVLGYARRAPAKDGPVMGHCEGILVKRELMPPVERRTFTRSVTRTSQILGKFFGDLFDSRGHLNPRYKGRGFWGGDSDDSWILIVTRISVDEKSRRQGVGSALVKGILAQVQLWAGNAPRGRTHSIFTVADPGVLRREAEAHIPPKNSSVGYMLQREQFRQAAHQRSEDFWHSLGFRKVGKNGWLAWTRTVGLALEHPTATDDEVDVESDLKLILKSGGMFYSFPFQGDSTSAL